MMQNGSAHTDKRVYGLLHGRVVGHEDNTGEARVQLNLPAFDRKLVFPGCRVAQLYAGAGYGSVWTPEEDDEVVVAFVDGDMRHPVVIGGLYNGKDKPPTRRDGSTDQKVFVTKGQHKIVFDDKANTVTVSTKTGTSIVLDGNGKNVTISADAKITLQARDIELRAKGGDVTVSGKTIRLN
jgi:uncharacterized protein involved in type VI secretion and phage assembly